MPRYSVDCYQIQPVSPTTDPRSAPLRKHANTPQSRGISWLDGLTNLFGTEPQPDRSPPAVETKWGAA
jgi:hypothetical protein